MLASSKIILTFADANLAAVVAELVDALDLGSNAARCVGSSPTDRTTIERPI